MNGSTERRALVTGVTGQDGAYLAHRLLAQGLLVFGTVRGSGAPRPWRLQALGIEQHPRLRLVPADLSDPAACLALLRDARPHEVYNLAAQSSVGASFQQPHATVQATALVVLNLLEAIRQADPGIRFFQASSAEMFGAAASQPLDENTPLLPRSPYAVSKVFAHGMTLTYREAHGLHASCGILFNHESPLRGPEFVTRKITTGAARLAAGATEPLALGNLDVRRDWGYAGEYVDAMVRMVRHERPGSYVLATGHGASVREFASLALDAAGLPHRWHGQGMQECALSADGARTLVRVAPEWFRPADIPVSVGNPAQAARVLGWRAATGLAALCRLMVRADLARQAGLPDSSFSK